MDEYLINLRHFAMKHTEYVHKTSAHYSKQWGQDLDFKTFIKKNPEAAAVMPGRLLPWPSLIDNIRRKAAITKTSVYDAACGFGDVFVQLSIDPCPPYLEYIGVDLHDGLTTLENHVQATFQQGDITEKIFSEERFDYVICRAALHHTPQPRETFRTLVTQLAPGGTIAFSCYNKKSPMREASDDALRSKIVPMEADQAFGIARQFSILGKDLQNTDGKIQISDDLPFLGIEAGTYGVQEFIYRYFLKCWYNPNYSEDHSDIVNFDWYHPPFAYRYDLDEVVDWIDDCGLKLVRTATIEAQHYLEAEKGK